ncbi:polysaccharide pyruvyl transferase family protein [Temperatibacter marinus]|uniref:Polysaccharide pyruvyl transferase family protein n=1 Tax=Temperatibacter marinus TaxID=1456591 RepID=A0AA52H9H0_9PROT|nr:polysaccharide pyruvyl transferase family protein [Temperatibacter marinus]WND03186.1 polysaccharide pyruvyl transferase family protein [Temperatibacter marinus]
MAEIKKHRTKILHIGCRAFPCGTAEAFSFQEVIHLSGQNLGNFFIGEAVCRHLRHYYADEVDISYYSIDDLKACSLHELDNKFDHIVMAASNLLRPNAYFNIYEKLLSATTLPITVMGLGAQAAEMSDEIVLTPTTERFVKMVSERSYKIGVRGAYTASILEKLSIHNIEITGCPTLYVNRAEDCDFNIPKDKPLRLALSTTHDNHDYRQYDQALDLYRKMFKYLLNAHSYHILQTHTIDAQLAAHATLSQNDLMATKKLYGLDSLEDADQLVSLSKVFYTYQQWSDFLKCHIDLAFGTRLHGNLMAITNGIPALFIAHDTRLLEICDYFSLPHLTLEELKDKPLTDALIRQNTDFTAFKTKLASQRPLFEDFLQNSLK